MSGRQRLAIMLQRGRLDRAIARGEDPANSEQLGLRARQLASAHTRRSVACSLRALIAAAENPRAMALSSAAPPDRAAVMAWREGLLGLADYLEQRGPVNPCSVARLLRLLTDGIGPLYNPGSEQSLGDAIWWVADGTRVCASRATTGDPAVRPA